MNLQIDKEITIEQSLLENKDFCIAVQNLLKNKKKRKVFYKAAEETNELGAKLLKEANTPFKVDDEDLLEEIVDVQMHLILVQKYFRKELKEKIIAEKVSKLINSKDYQKYKTIK